MAIVVGVAGPCRSLFSHQSLMPIGAGTRRYENWPPPPPFWIPAFAGIRGLVRRIGTADSATPHPDPSGGQAPALHSPLPTPLDSGLRRNDDEVVGRILVPMTGASRPHDEVVGRNDRGQPAAATSGPGRVALAGDKPQRYEFLFECRLSLLGRRRLVSPGSGPPRTALDRSLQGIAMGATLTRLAPVRLNGCLRRFLRQIEVVVGEDGLEVVAAFTYLPTAALKPIEDGNDFHNLTTGFLDRVRGIKQGPSGRHGIVDDDDSAARSKRPFNLFHGAVPLSGPRVR